MHIPSLSFLFYSPQPSLLFMHATLLLIFLFICPSFLSLHSFQMVILTVGVCHTLLRLLTFHVPLLSTFHSSFLRCSHSPFPLFSCSTFLLPPVPQPNGSPSTPYFPASHYRMQPLDRLPHSSPFCPKSSITQHLENHEVIIFTADIP